MMVNSDKKEESCQGNKEEVPLSLSRCTGTETGWRRLRNNWLSSVGQGGVKRGASVGSAVSCTASQRIF